MKDLASVRKGKRGEEDAEHMPRACVHICRCMGIHTCEQGYMHAIYKQVISTYIGRDSFSGSGVVTHPCDPRLWEVEGDKEIRLP